MGIIGERKMKPSEKKALTKQRQAKPLPPINDEGEVIYVPHITEVPELIDVLPELAEEYREIATKIAPLEIRKKEIGADIKALLDAVGRKSIRGNGWIVTRSMDTETETLSREKLLEFGVDIDVIEAAVVKTPKAGYVQVKKSKEEDNE